jgi:hypothetical protein
LVEVWASAVVAMLAFVLVSAGLSKLLRGSARSGRWRRTQGLGELIVAGLALVAPLRASGVVLAVVFVGFAIVHGRRRYSEEAADCTCFGDAAGPSAGARPLVLTILSACFGAFAAAAGGHSPAGWLAHSPRSGLAALATAVLFAHAWRVVFTSPANVTGRSDRLVTSSALFLERRFSRRGMLMRMAAVGSALTVAPLRYLLYPGTALAAISPGDCGRGACTDGYTAFCCQVNDGLNSCPSGTFAGGWWMCTDYPGRRLCAEHGVRYYVDCNALPGHEYPGGCRCADDSCDNQRVACNVFRYGQCNTQLGGVTAIVCRVVVCENPSTISELNCSASMAVDDAVCRQDTPCLQPRAIELPGAGGV